MGNFNVDSSDSNVEQNIRLKKTESGLFYNFIIKSLVLTIPLLVFYIYFYGFISIYNTPILFVISFCLCVTIKFLIKSDSMLIRLLNFESSIIFLTGCLLSSIIILYSSLNIQLLSSYIFFMYFIILMFATKQIVFNFVKKFFSFFYFLILANTLTFIYVGSVSLIIATIFIYLLGEDDNKKNQMGFSNNSFKLFFIFMAFVSISMIYIEKYIHFISIFYVDLAVYIILFLILLLLFYLEELHKSNLGKILIACFIFLGTYSIYISANTYI